MSLTLRKTVLVNGNRVDYPKLGDEVEVDYIGWLYEAGDLVVDHRGREFQRTNGKATLKLTVAADKMIKGWLESIPTMSLGEKSRLVVPASKAYGQSGIPGVVPANADLIFEITLRGINGKTSSVG